MHRIAALLAAAFAVLTACLTVPAVAETAPVITFPNITRHNPATPTAPYVLEIADEGGAGTLQVNAGAVDGPNTARWVDIPHTGMFEVTDWGRNFAVTVRVRRCVDGTCTTIASSPPVQAYDRLVVNNIGHDGYPSTALRPRLSAQVWPTLASEQVHLDWSVNTDKFGTGTTVVSGSGDYVTDAYGSVTVFPQLPAGISSGKYYLLVDASADLDGFGHLEGASYPPAEGSLESGAFYVDTDPPVGSTLELSDTSLYPVADRYKDTVTVRWHVEEYASSEVTIRNSAGTVVARNTEDSAPFNARFGWRWTGSDGHGGKVPAGSYTVRLIATDQQGNVTAPIVRRLTISSKRLVTKTFSQVVTAGGSTVGAKAGACSTLWWSGVRGWARPLGYRSNVRCDRGIDPSTVLTVNQLAVPAAFQNRYGSLRVTPYGGAAASRPRSQAVLFYQRNTDSAWTSLVRMSAPVGSHPGALVPAAAGYVHGKASTRPFVRWGMAVAQGNWYDVRSIRVRLNYVVLR